MTPFLLLLCSLPQGDAWSRFRGPNGSGVADVGGLPDRLDPEQTLAWKTELPAGHSSPVLDAEHVFLTALADEALITFALDRGTGEIAWDAVAPRPRQDAIDNRNHPASPSPAVDDDVVVVFFADFGLVAYDREGEELWRHALGPFRNLYGMGASPILAGDLVVLACDQSEGSFLAAFDKRTGDERWRVERPQAKSGHCTPILNTGEDGALELILPGSFFLDGYALATGEKRWYAGGLSFEMKSVPVIADGLVFINGYGSPMNDPGNQVDVGAFADVLAANDADENGLISREEMPPSRAAGWFDFVDLGGDGALDEDDWEYLSHALASTNGMLAFELGGEGDVTESSLKWAYRRGVPQLPSPLVYQGVLYMLADSGGLVTTFEPATGEVFEKGRLSGAVDTYYASPVAGDGKVYFASEHGILTVVPGGGSLEPLSTVDLGENVYATPALTEGRVFVRTTAALYCFGG